jgi:hypothetical protein
MRRSSGQALERMSRADQWWRLAAVARRAPGGPSRQSPALTPGQRRRRRRLDPKRSIRQYGRYAGRYAVPLCPHSARILPAFDGENFPCFFKGGPPGRRAADSAMPASRLAASLPARADSGCRDASGHAEAPTPSLRTPGPDRRQHDRVHGLDRADLPRERRRTRRSMGAERVWAVGAADLPA